jgi:hypothetical protein
MNRSRCDEHGRSVLGLFTRRCARPTGGSHGLTTDDPAQRFKSAMRRPRQGGSSAANNMGIIKAGAP